MLARRFTLAILATAALSAATHAAPEPARPQAATPFRENVKVEVTDKFLVVKSDGIPDHTTGDFPNRFNPNPIKKQNYTFKIPRQPQWSEKITRTPMGPIGVAINGVPFYNPYTAQGTDAAMNEVFDACCGHPDAMGRYHYHIFPKCLHTSFVDKAGEHSQLIGYAFDGYAIYGPQGENGKAPTDLDACNGHTDSIRGYHYHVTDKFPYILGGYHGVVEVANTDRGPRDGQGRPAGGRPPAREGEGDAAPPEGGRKRRPPAPREGGGDAQTRPEGERRRPPPPPREGNETRPGPREGDRRRPPPPPEGAQPAEGDHDRPPREGREGGKRRPLPPDADKPTGGTQI